MMIDTIVLYILIPVKLILILIQGQRSVRKQLLLCQYLTKFSIDLNGIWSTDETCWCDELHTHFVHSLFKGENPTYVILLKNL